MLFYPENAVVPEGLKLQDYLLRPLMPDDAELDYEAVMLSKAMLRKWSGTNYPPDDLTVEIHSDHIQRRWLEHGERTSFTFTITPLDKSMVLGGVLLDPLMRELIEGDADEDDLTTVLKYEGVASFWVRQDLIHQNFDREILNVLVDWFKREWKFSRVLFRANSNDIRQLQLLSELGRHHLYVLSPQNRVGKHILHG